MRAGAAGGDKLAQLKSAIAWLVTYVRIISGELIAASPSSESQYSNPRDRG